MLQKQDQAPDFELPTADMSMVKLSDYAGKKNLVLYFYPKDDTPGCTIEAMDFSELVDEFAAMDTVVLGISRDTCISHAAFRDKYGLTVELVADVDGEACEAYGVMKKKVVNGQERMGIQRSTFIIDKSGRVQHALYDVSPKGHAREVLELLRQL
ncbi:peroxiredoxin [Thiolapillus brandeum]|uniref:thioredoxin-dependent peroxiredoxin n=1 Tax=Thiolapillus brandeum TaxID=1076588 RepID=A0A7U6GKN2_9GAMM|nr:peroxiredoxin [Thiolapillus brandeum]BAO45405.1 peroxiredoxin Q/BCP [Thiolapillus brandeum]